MLEGRLSQVLYSIPNAVAYIEGSDEYPGIYGLVKFYQMNSGVLVAAEINGLPDMTVYNNINCMSPIFAFHIHEGNSCSGNAKDLFADALAHYNPYDCEHPYHAGDMPSLLSNGGYALSVFFTNRFFVKDIIGKTVIIHSMPDDFHTQPSGNSGEKIACGIVEVTRRV